MTHSFSRRTFLAYAGVAALGVSCLGKLPSAFAAVPLSQHDRLSGSLHIIGLNSASGLKPKGYVTPLSLISSIDLATGAVRQTEIPITDGHAALPIGGGRLACIAHHGMKSCVIDAEHKTMRVLEAPQGYVFGGHALVLPERKAFVVPVRRSLQTSMSDNGLFLFYDLETLEELEQIPSAGLHPHEMRFLPGGKEIAVTHYGEIHAPHPYYMHNVVAPKLSIYDATTFEEKRGFLQDGFDAMLTHMSIAPDGHAYCVMTQYYLVPPDQALSSGEQREKAIEFIKDATGKTPDFNVLPVGVAEGRIAMPLPFLRINTHTGEREELMPVPNDLIRSQSVACNQETGMAAATYYHSDTLVLHRAGEDAVILNGTAIGINGIRGVADIPGTPFLAVSGSANDAVILDTQTFDVVARYKQFNAHAPHVEFEKI